MNRRVVAIGIALLAVILIVSARVISKKRHALAAQEQARQADADAQRLRTWASIAQNRSLRRGFRAAEGTAPEPYMNTGLPMEIVNERTGMELVFIPAGEFLMGSPAHEVGESDDEKPHLVRVSKPFYICKHEVTVGEYKRFLGDLPKAYLRTQERVGIRTWRTPGFAQTDDHPVTCLGWGYIVGFCQGTGTRLPREAEWEYACRAGTRTAFSFGDTIDTDVANYNGELAHGPGSKGVFRRGTTPAGSFAPNAWGIYDMHGNVSEWCQDWEVGYGSGIRVAPEALTGDGIRVLRGGSWKDAPQDCRSASRDTDLPEGAANYTGFRVVIPARWSFLH